MQKIKEEVIFWIIPENGTLFFGSIWNIIRKIAAGKWPQKNMFWGEKEKSERCSELLEMARKL